MFTKEGLKELFIPHINRLSEEDDLAIENKRNAKRELTKLLNESQSYTLESSSHPVTRRQLIKTILYSNIKSLDDVKEIYEYCLYPFDLDAPLGDLYDEALKIFIENDLYEGRFNSKTYFVGIEGFKRKDKEASSGDYDYIDKYEYLLASLAHMKFNFDRHDEGFKDTKEALISELFNALCICTDSSSSIYEEIYDSEEVEEFEDAYEDAIDDLYYNVYYNDFLNFLILATIDNYYSSRRIVYERLVMNAKQSYNQLIFLNMLLYNEVPSEKELKDVHKGFLKEKENEEILKEALLHAILSIRDYLKYVVEDRFAIEKESDESLKKLIDETIDKLNNSVFNK